MEQSTVFGLAGDYPKAVSHDRLLLVGPLRIVPTGSVSTNGQALNFWGNSR